MTDTFASRVLLLFERAQQLVRMFGRVPKAGQSPLFDAELLGLGWHSQLPNQVIGERDRY